MRRTQNTLVQCLKIKRKTTNQADVWHVIGGKKEIQILEFTEVAQIPRGMIDGSNPPWKVIVRRTLGFIFLGKPFAAAY
jgi:hypothetical protein